MMIDHERRVVVLDGQTLRLTRVLFDLLACLSARPGVVRSREELLAAAWSDRAEMVNDRSVDTAVKRLKKIGITGIESYSGIGYFWDDGIRTTSGDI